VTEKEKKEPNMKIRRKKEKKMHDLVRKKWAL
jgi:hypothetical protein